MRDRMNDIIMLKRVFEAIQYMYGQLSKNEGEIIKNNIGERTITHKMAEYLQECFKDYHVDCEYNRNFEDGKNKSKTIEFLEDEYKILKGEGVRLAKEEKTICCYPDIIVHERMNNNRNLLIIEVKKDNNTSGKAGEKFDYIKLSEFTKCKRDNGKYRFTYGVHIVIGVESAKIPCKEVWFFDGEVVNKKDLLYMVQDGDKES